MLIQVKTYSEVFSEKMIENKGMKPIDLREKREKMREKREDARHPYCLYGMHDASFNH